MRLSSIGIRRVVQFAVVPLVVGGWTTNARTLTRTPARSGNWTLSVSISGTLPRIIRSPGVAKNFTANASGDGGGYSYQWWVTYAYGATYPAGNDRTQPISFQCSDNGDNDVTVVVTSPTGEAATSTVTQTVAIDQSLCNGY